MSHAPAVSDFVSRGSGASGGSGVGAAAAAAASAAPSFEEKKDEAALAAEAKRCVSFCCLEPLDRQLKHDLLFFCSRRPWQQARGFRSSTYSAPSSSAFVPYEPPAAAVASDAVASAGATAALNQMLASTKKLDSSATASKPADGAAATATTAAAEGDADGNGGGGSGSDGRSRLHGEISAVGYIHEVSESFDCLFNPIVVAELRCCRTRATPSRASRSAWAGTGGSRSGRTSPTSPSKVRESGTELSSLRSVRLGGIELMCIQRVVPICYGRFDCRLSIAIAELLYQIDDVRHSDDINCLAVCANRILATGGADGIIVLWNFDSGTRALP